MPASRAFFVFMNRTIFAALLLAAARAQAADDPAPPNRNFGIFTGDPEAYSIVSVADGLSEHKATYLLPFSYSRDFADHRNEVVFQISAKLQLLNSDFYAAYTQKSFWLLYNQKQSAPFRETDYNPEIFYRWTPDPDRFHHWGADFGFEHESNGQTLPQSRSWNRLYIAPFQARGKQLAHFKFWYRIPENAKTSPNDARGDDNPDIQRFYGYAEFRFQREFGELNQHAALMVRGNPATGRSAVELTFSLPYEKRGMFYCLYLWHGYGESLIDYNHQVTRAGIGIMLAR